MSISPNVVIMTKDELEKIKHEWFQKGVERGRFEEGFVRSNPKRTSGIADEASAKAAS